MDKNTRLAFIEGERLELLPINPENVKLKKLHNHCFITNTLSIILTD